MQHFVSSLRKAPANYFAEGLDWSSFPEIASFIYPDHFMGSRQGNGKRVLLLREKVCLVSEWVITSIDAHVRLRYGKTGFPPLWEGVHDYSAVIQAESQDLPFVYTYVVPISVVWYVGDGSYEVRIDHLLADGSASELGTVHFTLEERGREHEVQTRGFPQGD